jgi:hypothetical protein
LVCPEEGNEKISRNKIFFVGTLCWVHVGSTGEENFFPVSTNFSLPSAGQTK